MKKTLMLIILSISLLTYNTGYQQDISSKQFDLMFVLDNSGSMKQNDPEYLTKKSVLTFLEQLPNNSYIGFVLFAEKVDLAMPLDSYDKTNSKVKIEEVFEKLNYQGSYTDIPSAIERSFYELKQKGRKDSYKLIIFLTDGLIETSDANKDQEKSRWLKEILTEDCKSFGIKIFSIAFTEQADYELIQTLGIKTDGGYYRALTASDIASVFNKIKEVITMSVFSEKQGINKSQKPESLTVIHKDETEKSFSNELLIIISSITVLAVIILVVFFFIRRKRSASYDLDFEIPETYLVDVNSITNKASFRIQKKVTRIGRIESNDICIPDENNYISSFHATIEYKENTFFLEDQDSVNGTFLNGKKLEKKERLPLKGGDEIKFDKYLFKFLYPAEGERGETVLHIGEYASDSDSGGTVERLSENDESKSENSKNNKS